jgi:hypothetical protein
VNYLLCFGVGLSTFYLKKKKKERNKVKGVVELRMSHKHELRAASHYGRPSREAVGLSGQTLLRVQRNGLKIANQI